MTIHCKPTGVIQRSPKGNAVTTCKRSCRRGSPLLCWNGVYRSLPTSLPQLLGGLHLILSQMQLLFSACAGTDVFPSSFSTSASSFGASLLHSYIKYIVGYRTPGCPVPISPTAILIGQSGGQSVSLTLTLGNSGILPGWLLSSLLVLLTSLSYPVLWLLVAALSQTAVRRWFPTPVFLGPGPTGRVGAGWKRPPRCWGFTGWFPR